MGTLYEQFCEDAWEAYEANQKQHAALLFARARAAAEAVGDRVRAFDAGVWEAHSWSCAGENARAYALLFHRLAEAPEDAPAYERWIAEKQCYEIWLGLADRSLADLEARLARLEAWAGGRPGVPAADVCGLRAELARARGDFDSACRSCEEGWARHDGLGFAKSEFALSASECALELGRPGDARRWRDLLSRTEQERSYARNSLHRVDARLALYEGASVTTLDAARRALQDDLEGTQSASNATTRHLLARLHLLLHPGRDPDDPFHPARTLLRTRPEGGRSFERLTVIADYRLASVRHAVGVPPCDDLYHQAPRPLPEHLVIGNDLPLRIRRARLAQARLQAEAVHRDDLLETTWHRTRARLRVERLDAIVRAAGLEA